MPMEVCEARSLPLLLARSAIFRHPKLGLERALPSYLFHHDDCKITLHVRSPNCCLKSPFMSTRKGDKTLAWYTNLDRVHLKGSDSANNMDATSRKICKVLWSIEADIADGELLYITGDPLSLGNWEPEMAILLSPSTDQSNLWKTEVKIPCGMNFKYSYFVKGDKWPSCDITWRPGPEFSLSVPLHCIRNDKIVVRDTWLKKKIMMAPVPSWGSWMEDTDILPFQSTKLSGCKVPFSGGKESLKSLTTDSFGAKPLSIDLSIEDTTYLIEKEIEDNINNLENDLGPYISENDQPFEEPWLLHSLLSNEVYLATEETCIEFSDKGFQEIEKVRPGEETKHACIVESVSSVILINSSLCTMQRIALLEDEKLVELLLEPVKNNVRCGSVYLGVVTKLVPHMGGAFVDIGISRPSLMDIKPNREPFVYPPFRHKTKKEVNVSVIGEMKDHVGPTSHGEDEIINDFLEADHVETESFIHEDFEENEVDNDVEDSLALKGSTNGTLVDYYGGEADFEDDFEESENHMEEETVNGFVSLEMESSNDSEVSHHMLEDLKASNDSRSDTTKWSHVRKGTKVIVQVVKEGLGTKGPALTAYPSLRSRFWVLSTSCDRIGVSKKIVGVERTRLRVIAKTLQPPGFGLTVRTVAAGHSLEELQKDLDSLLSTWKDVVEQAKSAALAADEGVDGAVPVILHRAMGQTLSVVQDYFNEKVKSMVVDSPRTYHEVTNYLQKIAPDLCSRVELYAKRTPIFDEYGIEDEINNILSKRVPLSNGGSLVIEQTEALVSIDVNGGHGMLGQGTSQEKAILDVNLAAAKQIARELRLRDIGGIIVVDFIDMVDDANKRLVYEEIKKAVERDKSIVKVSELSRHGLMEITRKRVRPSVTFMISEPCLCCHATGRVEALETSYSKIEHEICRLLAISKLKSDTTNANSWPKFVLRVDRHMCNYLTAGKRTKLAILSSSLKVWILLKVARGFPRGVFEVKLYTDKMNNVEKQAGIYRLRPAEGGAYISSKLTVFPVKKWKARGK